MEVSVEVNKIIECTIYVAVFFYFRWRCDDVLVRLSLMEQIIGDTKNPKSNQSIPFLAIFPDLKNVIVLVCKLYFPGR